jgi:hypothetical protein
MIRTEIKLFYFSSSMWNYYRFKYLHKPRNGSTSRADDKFLRMIYSESDYLKYTIK